VKGILVLEDGTVYRADAIGRPGTAFGEIVFNTAMSGYQEVLTDPSYAGQIVVMTAAHVGNYGIRADEAESDRVHVAGFIADHHQRRHFYVRQRFDHAGVALGQHAPGRARQPRRIAMHDAGSFAAG